MAGAESGEHGFMAALHSASELSVSRNDGSGHNFDLDTMADQDDLIRQLARYIRHEARSIAEDLIDDVKADDDWPFGSDGSRLDEQDDDEDEDDERLDADGGER
jgi:hypothetical protein